MTQKYSRHAFTESDVAIFDAFINTKAISKYHMINNKRAYIELQLRDEMGFHRCYYDATDKTIVIQFRKFSNLLLVVRYFNARLKQEFLKITPRQYYTCQGI